jgi:hypothetical protein
MLPSRRKLRAGERAQCARGVDAGGTGVRKCAAQGEFTRVGGERVGRTRPVVEDLGEQARAVARARVEQVLLRRVVVTLCGKRAME